MNKLTVYLLLAGLSPIHISCQERNSEKHITSNEITGAEKIIGLEFTQSEKDSMVSGLERYLETYSSIREHAPANNTPPALVFNPLPAGFVPETHQRKIEWKWPDEVNIPEKKDDLAFYSVAELSVLIKNRKITSLELTQLYLDRLKKFGDTLQCIITLTEDIAIGQAKRADDELAKGIYRGPLHGIPYGIKDLFSLPGYPTTWGAMPFKDQVINDTSTVIRKLSDAGAVLVAKLTLGALAMGDVWYGGKTKNPWNPEQGSSGSSAGSASATVAGLVAFAIGTETWGSIVSPSNRCGVTGLRPSFGRVSRHGAMALSWSMDKIGPICRTAFDCAIVFNAIRGPDGKDPSVVEASFNYHYIPDLKNCKIGYFKDLFKSDYSNRKNDSLSLEIFKQQGVNLIPVVLPGSLPVQALSIILMAEASAAFDELTRSNKDSLMVRQGRNAWPNTFRQGRFIPAVEYIQANRIRYELIQQMHVLMKNFDAILTPTYGGDQLLLTNLTGNPCVVLPNGFTEEGNPASFTVLGNLYDEATVLAIARAYQEVTDFDEQHPPLFK